MSPAAVPEHLAQNERVVARLTPVQNDSILRYAGAHTLHISPYDNALMIR